MIRFNKISLCLIIITLVMIFIACPGPTDGGDAGDSGDGGDSGDSGDGGTVSYSYEWTELNPTGDIPDGRHKHGMVYIGDDKVILYGGQGSAGSTFTNMYEYDISTNTWTEISMTGTPQGEAAMGIVYDGNDNIILYGGIFAGETWGFDLTTNTWSNLNPTGNPTEDRFNHTMLLVDSNTALTSLGTQMSYWDADMWEYDISANTWTDLDTPDPEPTSRFNYAMTYNPDNDKVYLFGGSDIGGSGGDETWEYSVSDNVWSQLCLSSSHPAPRMAHTMQYIGNGIIILFGGETLAASSQFNDFWVYKVEHDVWTMYGLSNDPNIRANHKWVYIPESNKLIMFGGNYYDGSNYHYLNDVWELSITEE